MENINVLREIKNRIDDLEHDLCLYVPHTDEKIYINDTLRKLMSLCYEDQLRLAKANIKQTTLTINQQRELYGLKPIPNGDVILVPFANGGITDLKLGGKDAS